MNSPQVIQICPCFVDLKNETGGVANIVRQICLGLDDHGLPVTLFCGNRELGKVKALPGKLQLKNNITVHILSQRQHPMFGPWEELHQKIKSIQNPSFAHVHTCFSAFTDLGMLHLSREKIPFIFSPHGKLTNLGSQNRSKLKLFWWKHIAVKAVRKSRALFVESHQEFSQISKMKLNREVLFVPNGFDHNELINHRMNWGFNKPPYILFFGYLDPRKQPQFLIKAFSKTQTRRTHKLIIAGPDTYHNLHNIQREITKWGLEEKIEIRNQHLSGAEKWSLLSGAACFILPSRGPEGFPLAMVEALGAGIPLIISEQCNFSEAAVAGAAIELNTFDLDPWAAAIDTVCLNSQVRNDMIAATKRMADRYTWERIIEEYLLGYHQIFGKSNPGKG